MKQESSIRLVIGVVSVLLVSSTFYFASGLYQMSPNAQVTDKIQFVQDELRIQTEINVTDAAFIDESGSLKLSASTVADSEGLALFEVGTGDAVIAPLYPDLNISYSVFPYIRDSENVSSVLSLRLFNGTHVVVLQYFVGNGTIEHPYQNYIDVKYQIGTNTSSHFKGNRNIWGDLEKQGVDVNTSWKITNVGFGVTSLVMSKTIGNSSLQAIFGLNETQLSYDESTLALVDSSSITFSRTAFLGLLVTASAFVIMSGEYLIMSRQKRQNREK
jgi:hypothetical protein